MQALELSLNFVTGVFVDERDFKQLSFLDLSYNSLSGVSLLRLGTLSGLKELHLTGNNLVALPAEMSMPFLPLGANMYVFRRIIKGRGSLWIIAQP